MQIPQTDVCQDGACKEQTQGKGPKRWPKLEACQYKNCSTQLEVLPSSFSVPLLNFGSQLLKMHSQCTHLSLGQEYQWQENQWLKALLGHMHDHAWQPAACRVHALPLLRL